MSARAIGNHVVTNSRETTRFAPLPGHEISHDAFKDDDFSLKLSYAANGEPDLRICRSGSAVRLFKKLWQILLPIFSEFIRDWVLFSRRNHETEIVVRQNTSPVVADAGAATPGDPALTVQEGIDGVTPAVGVAGVCNCAAPASTSEGTSDSANGPLFNPELITSVYRSDPGWVYLAPELDAAISHDAKPDESHARATTSGTSMATCTCGETKGESR